MLRVDPGAGARLRRLQAWGSCARRGRSVLAASDASSGSRRSISPRCLASPEGIYVEGSNKQHRVQVEIVQRAPKSYYQFERSGIAPRPRVFWDLESAKNGYIWHLNLPEASTHSGIRRFFPLRRVDRLLRSKVGNRPNRHSFRSW